MIKTELIPVIHTINENQINTNIERCIKCGIDKIFLINHGYYDGDIIEYSKIIKHKYNIWVGLNLLNKTAIESYSMNIEHIDALWCDEFIKYDEVSKYRQFEGLLFGGVAFKYQPQPKDLKLSCDESVKSIDVVTTSGVGTGIEADLNKIIKIRDYIQKHPMAIASGVNSKNISSYKGIVNYILVASSITSYGELIDIDKLSELKSLLD